MPSLKTTRIRVNSDVRSDPYDHILYDPSGNFHHSDSGYIDTFGNYSAIYDNVNRRVSGRYPESDCHSIRIQGKFREPNSFYFEDGGWKVVTLHNPIPCTPSQVVAVVPSISDSQWDSFFYDAFLELSEQVPQEIDIFNFLWEGREVATLLPKLQSTLSQTVTGGYLNLEFGWKPFLGDLHTLGNLVSIVQSKLNRLIEINGKTTRLSKTSKDVLSIPYIRPWVGEGMQYRLSSYRADLRVSGRLTADLYDLKSEAAFWRTAAVTLGLTNPLRSFWESIPFSFVLDWFNQIGSRIFNLTVNPFQGRWEISRLTTSCRETAKVDLRVNYKSHLNPVYQVGTFTVSRYTRYAGFPAQPSIFNIDVLSPKQQTLMLALLNGVR